MEEERIDTNLTYLTKQGSKSSLDYYDGCEMEFDDFFMDESFTESNDTSANDWHEERINKRTVVDKMIEEYINSFTLHGLTKVFIARSKLESLFWLVMLLSGILLSAYVSISLVGKYLSYEVYTEIKLQITEKNYFPAITICERNILYSHYYRYCAGQLETNQTCLYPERRAYVDPMNITTDNATWWSNGLLNVTKCQTWGGKHCLSSNYITSMTRYNHACISINYRGDLYDMYSHVDIELRMLDNRSTTFDIMMLSHDPLVSEIDLTNSISLEPKIYDVNLEKTVIQRLPFPFPSKCTDLKSNDMFPEKYTRRGCLETQNYLGMFKHCGDTLDYVRQFIPEAIIRAYARNETVAEHTQCMMAYGRREANTSSQSCPFPCSETDLNMLVSSRNYRPDDPRNNKNTYTVGVQYLKVDSYRLVKEKQLYSGYQMACEIGGLIGLMVGCSLLSGIEIFVCFILWIIKQLSRL